jgi:hypothetical protein
VRRLFATAKRKKITLTPKNTVDPYTVARQVWPALQIARNFGFALGKYGLFPLTLDEISAVIRLTQSWFEDWSAAPVFYIDLPLVTSEEIYEESNILQGLKLWLHTVAEAKVPVVLIDTALKSKGRRLMKSHPSDSRGVLHTHEIEAIDEYATQRGVKTLWAGGITLEQAYEFGALGVFGIYVTSAAARDIPRGLSSEADPSQSSQRRLTRAGVKVAKLLLEAGFLAGNPSLKNTTVSTRIRESAKKLISGDTMGAASSLQSAVEDGWRAIIKSRKGKIKN